MSIICCLSYLYSFSHYDSLFSPYLWLFIGIWKWPSPLLFWASMHEFGCIAWLSSTFCYWLNTTCVQLCNSSVFEPRIFQSSLYRMGSLSFSFQKCSYYILYDHIFSSLYKLNFYCKDIFWNIYISVIKDTEDWHLYAAFLIHCR